MSYKQGDIILVPFPFTDLTGTKVRPAIVLSNSQINRSNDVIIAQITSQEITGDFAFQISNAEVTTPFKPPYNTQYIYCKKIAVVEQSLISKKITQIRERETLESILTVVRSIFTIGS